MIIPSKNSGRTIGKCLESIMRQTYKNLEIIVCDDFSTDRTQEICLEHGAKIIRADGERTRAKNRGLMESRGEFLFFVDSDMMLEPTVVEECVNICRKDCVAGVIIPERSIGSGFWVKVRDFERGFYAGSKIESARFFRRQPVMDVGGFDEGYVWFEESTLPQKIENKFSLNVNARISSLILHDEEGFNLKKWLIKKRYYHSSAKDYSAQYSYGNLQMSPLYRIRLFTSSGKWKILLRHPILATGVAVLKFLEYANTRI